MAGALTRELRFPTAVFPAIATTALVIPVSAVGGALRTLRCLERHARGLRQPMRYSASVWALHIWPHTLQRVTARWASWQGQSVKHSAQMKCARSPPARVAWCLGSTRTDRRSSVAVTPSSRSRRHGHSRANWSTCRSTARDRRPPGRRRRRAAVGRSALTGHHGSGARSARTCRRNSVPVRTTSLFFSLAGLLSAGLVEALNTARVRGTLSPSIRRRVHIRKASLKDSRMCARLFGKPLGSTSGFLFNRVERSG